MFVCGEGVQRRQARVGHQMRVVAKRDQPLEGRAQFRATKVC